MLIGFSTSAGIFILAPVSEREFKLRYLMNFLGLKSLAYYLGNLITDVSLITLPILGFLVIMAVLSFEAFKNAWYLVLILLVCFGYSLITLTYLFNFFFDKSQTAFRMIGVIYLLVGFLLPNILLSIILAALSTSSMKVFNIIFSVDPFYSFTLSMLYIFLNLMPNMN